MKKRALVSVLGILVLILGVALIIPTTVAWRLGSVEELPAFLWSIGACVAVGALGAVTSSGGYRDLGAREGFAVVGLGWVVISAFGALPFWLAPSGIPSYLDAYFETMSGFTTTGASVLRDIEALPPGLLLWRSLTHWLGGMGIVVLTVAILPFLGAGGCQMLRAELPGPTADKLAPRIAQTAAILWLVYCVLTVAQLLLLWPAMGLFDATCHALGTMSTGGFSTRNASIDQFGSVYIDAIVTLFMFLAGANFVLHFRALAGKGFPYPRDREFRFYLATVAVAIAVITAFLFIADFPDRTAHPEKYDSLGQCLRYASFQVCSIFTTTGFVTADFDRWPSVCRVVIILLMVIGGCAGSTAGGVKCIRVLMLTRFGLREIQRLVRPHAVIPLRIGGQVIERAIISRVMGFICLYIVVFVLSVPVLSMIIEGSAGIGPSAAIGTGTTDGAEPLPSGAAAGNASLLTAFGAALATIGNIGPGLAGVGPVENYGGIPAAGKGVLILLMLLGRLEIYAVLVLFVPLTWRR